MGYLFAINPGPAFKYYVPLIIISALLIISSMVFSTIYKQRKKHDFAFKRLFRKTSSTMLIFGILFLLLVALRYENIPYFSMRIWLYLAILAILYFTYRYIKKYLVDYPREKQNAQSKHVKVTKEEKVYLPNKKRR